MFSTADLSVSPTQPGLCDLAIDVTEKWTTIPVARAVYGGGTPLYVLGSYDTHVAGKLYALGAEMRRYGARSFFICEGAASVFWAR